MAKIKKETKTSSFRHDEKLDLVIAEGIRISGNNKTNFFKDAIKDYVANLKDALEQEEPISEQVEIEPKRDQNPTDFPFKSSCKKELIHNFTDHSHTMAIYNHMVEKAEECDLWMTVKFDPKGCSNLKLDSRYMEEIFMPDLERRILNKRNLSKVPKGKRLKWYGFPEGYKENGELPHWHVVIDTVGNYGPEELYTDAMHLVDKAHGKRGCRFADPKGNDLRDKYIWTDFLYKDEGGARYSVKELMKSSRAFDDILYNQYAVSFQSTEK